MYARERAERNYKDQEYMDEKQTARADIVWKVVKWIVFVIVLILASKVI